MISSTHAACAVGLVCAPSCAAAFGPQQLRWLKPSTSEEIGTLATRGVSTLVLVPISFVFEHMATLNEMDREFKQLGGRWWIGHRASLPERRASA